MAEIDPNEFKKLQKSVDKLLGRAGDLEVKPSSEKLKAELNEAKAADAELEAAKAKEHAAEEQAKAAESAPASTPASVSAAPSSGESSSAAKQAAKATVDAAKKAGAATVSAAEKAGRATVGAAKKTAAAGGSALRGVGNVGGAGLGFIARQTLGSSLEEGAVTTFLVIAMVFNLFDLMGIFGGAPTSFRTFMDLRAGLYIILALTAYFVLYHGRGGFNWRAFGICFGISALSYFIPLGMQYLQSLTYLMNIMTFFLLIAPPWAIYLVITTEFFPKLKIVYIILIIIMIIAYLMIHFGAPTLTSASINLNPVARASLVIRDIADGLGKFRASFTGVGDRLWKGGRAVLASIGGEYYMGMVDENEHEPLGIYLKEIRVTQHEYFEDEPITVYTTLQGKNLDETMEGRDQEAITVTLGCDADNIAGEVLPENEVQVFNFVERQYDCFFDRDVIKPGTHTVAFNANFNFRTMSYYKSYFMDAERKRAMQREQIDPFRQYGITDTRPLAVFSNGPVHVGMEVTQDMPVGLYTQDVRGAGSNSFMLGITLDNYWTGEVRSVGRMVLMLPTKYITLQHDANREDTFCGGYIFKTCDQLTPDELAQSRECADFGEDHNIYIYYKKHIKDSNLIDISENFQTLRCRMNVRSEDAGLLLGASPVSTQYFKVTVDYDYSIKSELPINVKEVEGYKASTIQGYACQKSAYNKQGLVIDNLLRSNYVKRQASVRSSITTVPTHFQRAHIEAALAAIMSKMSAGGALNNLTDPDGTKEVDYIMGGCTSNKNDQKGDIRCAAEVITKEIKSLQDTNPQYKDSINYLMLKAFDKYYEQINRAANRDRFLCNPAYASFNDMGLCQTDMAQHKSKFIDDVFALYTKWLNTLCIAGRVTAPSTGDLSWPVPAHYRITSCYGARTDPITGASDSFHQAIDIGASTEEPNPRVFSADSGRVVYARDNSEQFSQGGYGNLVIIEHDSAARGKYYTGYAHLDSIDPNIKNNVQVQKGELLGIMGHTGRGTGVHLHFFMMFGERPVPIPAGGITNRAIGTYFPYSECWQSTDKWKCNPICYFPSVTPIFLGSNCDNPDAKCEGSGWKKGKWPAAIVSAGEPGAQASPTGPLTFESKPSCSQMTGASSANCRWSLNGQAECQASISGTVTPISSPVQQGTLNNNVYEYSYTFSGLDPNTYNVAVSCWTSDRSEHADESTSFTITAASSSPTTGAPSAGATCTAANVETCCAGDIYKNGCAIAYQNQVDNLISTGIIGGPLIDYMDLLAEADPDRVTVDFIGLYHKLCDSGSPYRNQLVVNCMSWKDYAKSQAESMGIPFP